MGNAYGVVGKSRAKAANRGTNQPTVGRGKWGIDTSSATYGERGKKPNNSVETNNARVRLSRRPRHARQPQGRRRASHLSEVTLRPLNHVWFVGFGLLHWLGQLPLEFLGVDIEALAGFDGFLNHLLPHLGILFGEFPARAAVRAFG